MSSQQPPEGESGNSAPEEQSRLWAARPDPFGIQSIFWSDGYRVSLKESDSNREIYIQFGSGAKSDTPQNFEAIRKMFKEEFGMYWDGQVQGWAKEVKPGVTPLIKEQNSRVRAAVTEAFFRAVALEESARGPSLSDYARARAAAAR